MTFEVSPNTQAILLLTAPLIAGRGKSRSSVKPLGAAEYHQLAQRLRELAREPADLLNADGRELLEDGWLGLNPERLARLLGRSFLLVQAVERWRTRAIWVLSRADADYPRRLKKQLGQDMPPVLYGCGDTRILATGGLAVVGSRNVDEELLEYTDNVGRLVASAGRILVSGGARGVDRAAMTGALDAGGRVVGVLADSLEKAAMLRRHREVLMDGRLVLISQYDPIAHFQVWRAMQRNKLIYSLADAALVVNSDYGSGGTWAGATEQLDKPEPMPVYVRTKGRLGKGIDDLRHRGAKAWPEPDNSDALGRILDEGTSMSTGEPEQQVLSSAYRAESIPPEDVRPELPISAPMSNSRPVSNLESANPADELFATARRLIERMDGSRTEASVHDALAISKAQARLWLLRFTEEKIIEMFTGVDMYKTPDEVAETLQIDLREVRLCLKCLAEKGTLEKLYRPVRYRFRGSHLFGPQTHLARGLEVAR